MMIISNYRNHIKQWIYKKVKKVYLVQNVNCDLCENQKRVLISYIDSNFRTNLEQPKHTNILEVNQIIKVFSDLNYCIDIALQSDLNVLDFIENKKYDIIFGQGKIFEILVNKNPQAKKILYLTENPPYFSKIKEKERIDYYYFRHNIKVSFQRTNAYITEEQIKLADVIICMGEPNLLNVYNKKIFEISPSGHKNINYNTTNKEMEFCKNNFLWMGSSGAIHKGLDLLVDVFSKQGKLKLHIAGLNKKDRKTIKLPMHPCIIDHGFVNMQGNDFLKLVNICGFIILPSCSEGCSTSVLTGMRHGLIPVVLKDSGFNKLASYSIFLTDFHIDVLKKEIIEIANKDSDLLEQMQKDVFQYANSMFTLDYFTNNFKKIIKEII